MLAAFFRGVAARAETQHRDRAWLAWHVAALGRAEKLPKLKTLTPEKRPPRRRQTAEEMLAIAEAWAARGVGVLH